MLTAAEDKGVVDTTPDSSRRCIGSVRLQNGADILLCSWCECKGSQTNQEFCLLNCVAWFHLLLNPHYLSLKGGSVSPFEQGMQMSKVCISSSFGDNLSRYKEKLSGEEDTAENTDLVPIWAREQKRVNRRSERENIWGVEQKRRNVDFRRSQVARTGRTRNATESWAPMQNAQCLPTTSGVGKHCGTSAIEF